MHTQMGLAHFWSQGDLVTHTTAVILALLSLASWSVIISKIFSSWRAARAQERAIGAFWNANSLPEALETLRHEDRSAVFAGLALAGAHAAQAHQQNAARGIGAGVNASEFVTRALRSHIVTAQARIERGLTFLASVGSTAPFIGLFGTVWGIYHALVGLSGATQVVLDKVAGPVGEALIMTAAGLFVAIPAVLAYNAFTRANRLVLAQLDGFAHDLHAYLTTGVRVGGNANLVDIGAVRASRGANMAFGSFEECGASQPMAEINTTPLVDVMLVLLVIFIITAPLFHQAVPIDLPQVSATKLDDKPQVIQLAVDATGHLYWNGEPIGRANLESRFAAASATQPELHLRADRKVVYEKVADVMAAAQRSGIVKIAFVTESAR